jgi:DUF971 family protein
MSDITPTNIHLIKTEALEVTWADGQTTRFPLRFLRKWCPCAGCQGERDILGRAILPIVKTTYDGPITATGGAMVGNYAIRIDFSDGHDTGIYSFKYLNSLREKLTAEIPT